MSQRQLTKSVNNRMISGVIAGIAEYFGWGRDVVTILRILFVVLAFGSWGGLIFLYFIASWIIPSAGNRGNYNGRNGDYQERWNQKSQHFDQKMDDWSERYSDKMDKWAQRYDEKFDPSRKNNSWNNPWEEPKKNQGRKMRDAEPIVDEKEEDWSDF